VLLRGALCRRRGRRCRTKLRFLCHGLPSPHASGPFPAPRSIDRARTFHRQRHPTGTRLLATETGPTFLIGHVETVALSVDGSCASGLDAATQQFS
jgi:hypothetical protein